VITVEGEKFDSMREFNRYYELKLMERSGAITNLVRTPKFPFRHNEQLICRYEGDFSYREGGKLIVEDVKSPVTRKDPVYRLKNKMLKAFYGIQIREVL
jgi:hypothetical protein